MIEDAKSDPKGPAKLAFQGSIPETTSSLGAAAVFGSTIGKNSQNGNIHRLVERNDTVIEHISRNR